MNISTIGMLRRCLNELQQGGANVLGVVLNGIRPTRGGYLSRNMEQYYAYSEGRTTGMELDSDLPEMAVLEEDVSGPRIFHRRSCWSTSPPRTASSRETIRRGY